MYFSYCTIGKDLEVTQTEVIDGNITVHFEKPDAKYGFKTLDYMIPANQMIDCFGFSKSEEEWLVDFCKRSTRLLFENAKRNIVPQDPGKEITFMVKKSLGDRMKQYEEVTRVHLMRRTPIIIRIDGRSFHTFTKGFTKPFDEILINTMQQTMLELCEGIEGCVMGYTQSDEISLVLCDYRKLDSEPWFGNVLVKVCSVSASIATSAFNKNFRNAVSGLDGVYQRRIDQATFDSRAFNVPQDEVCNYFIWRQQDAIRNSIEATSQAYFSHKRLLGVTCKDAAEMLRTEKSVDWETFSLFQQRGTCCIKQPVLVNEGTKDEKLRNKWILDTEIPLFTENRDYVESRIYFQGM